MPDAVCHADAFKRFHHSLLAIDRWHSLTISQRQFDVFINCEIADQVETLEDESNFLIANARARAEVQIFDRLAVQLIFPFGWSVEQADDREQRRLPASRRAGHGHVLSLANRQVNAGECVGFDFVGVEDLGELFNLNQWLCGLNHNSPRTRLLCDVLLCAPPGPLWLSSKSANH